jgi:hypothetical protein
MVSKLSKRVTDRYPQEQHHLGKIADKTFYQQSVEILAALQKLKQTVR